MFQKLFKPTHLKYMCKNYSSALYITGDKANKHFAVLTPVTDFETIVKQKDTFQNNLNSRQISIDLDKIMDKWRFFQQLQQKRQKLERNRLDIGAHISKLLKEQPNNSSEIDKWKVQSKILKEDLKNLKDMYYMVDEDIHLQILDLPNDLHANTPIDKAILIHERLNKPDGSTASHLDIQKDSIDYINPYCCYLEGEPALFEIASMNYLKRLLANEHFVPFSSPDFSRSIVVEGCGKSFDTREVFTLEEPHDKFDTLSRLHLTGGASLEAYMAYFTKHYVIPNAFPLQYFSMGRLYQPHNPNRPNDLFNLCQFSAVNVFSAYLANEENLLDNIQRVLKQFYDSLACHYKIELLDAKNIGDSEALRLSVQMYSNSSKAYVEVGFLSLYGDYLSKRLLFNTTQDKVTIYPKVMFGTLLNVQKVLGCVIENNSVCKRGLLNDLLQKYLFL